MSYAQLEKRHVEAYRKQFATSSLVLPTDINASLPTNQRLEKFAGSKDMAMVALMYNYGRYLLVLGRIVTHQGAACQHQVRTCSIQAFIYQEVLLLPTEIGNNFLYIRVEVVANLCCCYVYSVQ